MFVIFQQAVKTKVRILFLKSERLVLHLSTKIVDYYPHLRYEANAQFGFQYYRNSEYLLLRTGLTRFSRQALTAY